MAVALAVTVLSTACGGPAPTPAASPPGATSPDTSASTPVPSPDAPPSEVLPDLALADRLYGDGDLEGAIAIYSAAAIKGDDDQRRRALWGLARVGYEEGDLAKAEQALVAFFALGPPPEEAAPARLLLGLAQLARGDDALAEVSLRRYVDEGGPAGPYARLQLAELAGRRGDQAIALLEVEAALALGLPPELETGARFALARYQEAVGLDASALATYQELSWAATTAAQRGEALWLLADLALRLGDLALYQQSLYTLAAAHPWHPRALESLAQPQLAPGPVLSTSQRALVLFHHRFNDQAAETFRAVLAEEPGPEGEAVAHYYLGILAERVGDPWAALEEYEAARAALQGDPAHPLFAQASWDRALILEALGYQEEAADAFLALAEAAPLAEQAPEALFRAGLIHFRLGRVGGAALPWERYLAWTTTPAAQARAHFWLGRAAQALGDGAAAAQHFAAAAEAAPWNYYGLRARALTAGEGGPQDQTRELQLPVPDWIGIEEWLHSWAGPEDPSTSQSFLLGAAWQLGHEMAQAGLQDEAKPILAGLVDRSAGQPWRLYRLARSFHAEGLVSLAAQAAARLAWTHGDPPRQLLTLAYPLDHLDLATEAAVDNGLSPLLLLALVRQESFFDVRAVSSAGALGLTQVMPATAQEIASSLQVSGFRNSDLLRPRVSLRFGAYYLRAQLDLFDGALSMALAAYNGGPGNALRWLKLAPHDPDLFLEIIDFPETRQYVQFVLENYAIYRYTYGQDEEPSLLLP